MIMTLEGGWKRLILMEPSSEKFDFFLGKESQIGG